MTVKREINFKNLNGNDTIPVNLRVAHLSLITHYLLWQRARKAQPVVPKRNKALMEYSTRKIRAQKRTGKPPIGSRSSTMLRGGAICHGPVKRVRTFYMNKRSRKIAIETLIGTRFIGDKLYYSDSDKLPKAESTKEYLDKIRKLGLNSSQKILYVTSNKHGYWKGLRNVPNHNCIEFNAINCSTLIKHNILVFEKGLIERNSNETLFLRNN